MDPLSLEASLKLLKQSCGESPLLKNDSFKILLRELGIVPRYLLWFKELIERSPSHWRKPGDEMSSISPLGNMFIEQNDFQIESLVAHFGTELSKFLSWCLSGTIVSWDTKINNYTLSELATKGNIFLLRCGDGFRLWLPGVLLHLLAKHSNQTLLQKIAYFPAFNWNMAKI